MGQVIFYLGIIFGIYMVAFRKCLLSKEECIKEAIRHCFFLNFYN